MKPTGSLASPRLIGPNRDQLLLRSVDVEKLVGDDHPARAIWEFVGHLDLSAYEEKIKSVEGCAGRPAYDPRLLISIWIYAYSDGESSGREIERLCGYDPAYQWLTGMEEISHHTLSDFRVDHGKELDDLFTQVLGLLSAEDLVTLKRVTQDGTKVKACASSKTFRCEATIQEHLDTARSHVAAMGDPRIDIDGARREKARARALRERQERLEKALEELPKIRARKRDEEERRDARVSETDPEARVMKQSDGGYAPSYNVQLNVDGEHAIIVNASVSQAGNDNAELMGALAKVEERTGKKPEQVLGDGGYTNHVNIMAMAAAGIDFIGSLKDTSTKVDTQYARRGVEPEFRKEAFIYDTEADLYICPAGEELHHNGRYHHRPGITHHTYQTSRGTCGACIFRGKCYSGRNSRGRKVIRIVEESAIVEFREKMETDKAKAIYKLRSQTAEFPNAWLKEKLGLRQFRTRGMRKTIQETLWACVTYNIQQWIRLIWRPQLAVSSG